MFRILLFIIILAFSAACSREDGGHKPYPDRSRYEIIGVDISSHNGEIDFDAVAADGVSFVIIKATEGGTFKDKKFIENVRRAKEAGLKVGAYHFFRFDTPGYIQGLNFLNSLQGRELDLPLAIDVEEWSNPTSHPTPIVLNRLAELIEHLENHGQRVMLYTNKNGHSRFIRAHLEGYPLWICSLMEEPKGIKWSLWQCTHNGRIKGIDTPVDLNAFSGNREEWEKFASGSNQAGQ